MANTTQIKVKHLIEQLEKLEQEECIVVDDGVGNFDNEQSVIITHNGTVYVIY